MTKKPKAFRVNKDPRQVAIERTRVPVEKLHKPGDLARCGGNEVVVLAVKGLTALVWEPALLRPEALLYDVMLRDLT